MKQYTINYNAGNIPAWRGYLVTIVDDKIVKKGNVYSDFPVSEVIDQLTVDGKEVFCTRLGAYLLDKEVSLPNMQSVRVDRPRYMKLMRRLMDRRKFTQETFVGSKLEKLRAVKAAGKPTQSDLLQIGVEV
tara:strand:+ start:2234 stop:2626 length:393 start_codon:yes stop_codon:yes gene_type:complete